MNKKSILLPPIPPPAQESKETIEKIQFLPDPPIVPEGTFYSLGTPEPDRLPQRFPWQIVILCFTVGIIIFSAIVYLLGPKS